ncbi:DinB family protein [Fictibacillus aquaticus]|uniref:DinB-like domain-containing protein n=1 Tax=Fictibacillus aquaticus TaxID=2021314 RepID=A0A235FBN1_9BACL|nr:DinB family protein [Fictibacillus aquaticus]OYD58599.1 hypothetical protein CGZ90_01475 [Fictibacillus aquaticus]
MDKIIQFINEERARLWITAEGLSEEQLNDQSEPEKWSVMQVLQHLYLIEKSITRSIQDHIKKVDVLATENKPIHLTVDRTTKVEAPDYVIPSREFTTMQTMRDRLEGSRKALLELVSGTDHDEMCKKGFKHPIFGMLNLEQWVEFIGYHEKRHIFQIEEIIADKLINKQ